MKRFLLLLTLLGLTLFSQAQTPTWQTAITAAQANGSFCVVRATASDASGNLYLVGGFIGQVAFGNSVLTNTGGGLDDVFVAKWNPTTNQFVWALQAGGPIPGTPRTGQDIAYSVAVSGNNIYVGGTFTSLTATFGSTTLVKSTTPTNQYDGFIAKITDTGTSGNWIWAKRVGREFTQVQGLAVAGTSLYATGWYSGYGSDFGHTLLDPAGQFDMFITKLTDAGDTASFVWTQRAGGENYDEGKAVSVSDSSVYVTGPFSSRVATFGNYTLANSPTGGPDMFVTKLTDRGATSRFKWALSAIGRGGNEVPETLAVSGNNLYIAGSFTSASFPLGPYTLVNAGVPNSAGQITSDIFVTKIFDGGNSGTITWAQRAGGPGDDAATGIAIAQARIYIGGKFSNTAAFGASTLTSAGEQDIFVAHLADAGATATFKWAQRAGGTNYDEPYGLGIRGNDLYVGGFTLSGVVGFSNTTLSCNAGEWNVFGAWLSETTPLATAAGLLTVKAGIYPNPLRQPQELTIRLSDKPGTLQATLTLTNMLGQMMRTQVIGVATDNTAKLMVADLRPGYYHLRVQTKAQDMNYPFIIQ